MQMRICLAVVLSVALLVGGLSSSALALCSKTVKVIKVFTSDSGVHYVYGQDLFHVLPGYIWYRTIDNDDLELLTTAQTAYATGAPATVQGTADECPADGVERFDGMVNAIWVTGK